MNYLQYIHSVYHQAAPSGVHMNFLVSGVDPHVRQVIGQHVVDAAYAEGKILFIVDNTRSGSAFTSFGSFQVVNPLNGEIDLCHELFETKSLYEISRLRTLLADLGFEGSKAMKVVAYLSFVRETERRLGNTGFLSAEVLEEYGSTSLVNWKLRQVLERGMLSKDSYEYLLGRYAEVSAAAADFELFLVMLAPFLSGTCPPSAGTAVHLPVGEFCSDRPMQEILCKLMIANIKKQPENCVVIIVDGGKGDRSCIMEVLNTISTAAAVHLITADAFSLDDSALSVLMNTFSVRIYSRHEAMSSCAKVEDCCGHVEVVKRSYTTTVDRRIRAATAFDMLLGTNRTETESYHTAVLEAHYRKETIHSLCPGAAIIDCGGIQALFQF